MFMNQNTFYKYVMSPQIDLWIRCSPNQYCRSLFFFFFKENWQSDSKIVMGIKGIKITNKAVKKNNLEGLH